jgi:predicted YcjX-like family ATPase
VTHEFGDKKEIAVFPGDLPSDVSQLFDAGSEPSRAAMPRLTKKGDFRAVRFRPPALELTDDGVPALPHIRLDRALQFLIGDRLR